MLGQHKEFASLAGQLSLSFDRLGDWLAEDAPATEINKQLHALQLAGLVGLCVDCEKESSENRAKSCSFPPLPGGIRKAGRRLALFFPELNQLFSPYSPTNAIPPIRSSDAGDDRDCTGRKKGAALMHYLDDDMLRHVFSFLGYKRLVRIRSVSQHWKSIADRDRLWRFLYESRFSTMQDDDLAHDEATPWRKDFVEKWLVERDVRFRRDSNGWKARVCGYFGCMQVLTSRKRFNKHLARHQREMTQKRKASQSASQQRKRTRTKLKANIET